MTLTIRKVSLTDINSLQELGVKTFSDTFAYANTPENMQTYLNKAFSMSALEQQLSNTESEFYFAQQDESIVGYLKINWGKAMTNGSLLDALEIERIYVLDDYQGLRVGKKLFEFSVNLACNRHFQKLWLGVWDQNAKAIEFYKRQGFDVFDSHKFYLGDDLQSDLMMKMNLL